MPALARTATVAAAACALLSMAAAARRMRSACLRMMRASMTTMDHGNGRARIQIKANAEKAATTASGTITICNSASDLWIVPV